MVLELREELLDRIEIRGILGKEQELGARRADGLANGLSLVATEIVHDHDIAGLERRHEQLEGDRNLV